MYLLFLDTETNSLSPKTGSIIEVAGVVVDLDPQTLALQVVDQYESLIQLEGEFDPKITRLTTITEPELREAPPKTQVQDEWREFVEKYNIAAIIGHSIDFDINFLSEENWYLPADYKMLDTLLHAKILFPHLSAVNLEYIFFQLQLQPSYTRIAPKTVQNQLHRALYDTYLCITFFEHALTVLSSQSLVSSPIYEQITQDILPEGIILFNPYQPKIQQNTEQTATQKSVTGWFGPSSRIDFDRSIDQLVNTNSISSLLEKLALLINQTRHPQYRQLLYSIGTSVVAKQSNPKNTVYLHMFGGDSYSYVQSVLAYLAPTAQEQEYDLKLEDLVGQISRANTTRLAFAKVNSLLTVANYLTPETDIATDWFRQYDFWLFYANQLAVEGTINPYGSDPALQVFFARFATMQQLCITLMDSLDQLLGTSLLKPILAKSIQGELNTIRTFPWKNGILESIVVTDTDIQLTNTIANAATHALIEHYGTLANTIYTYCSQQSTERVIEILSLPIHQQAIQYKSANSSIITIDAHNLLETLERVRGKKALVLISQSKHLTKIQNILTTQWSANEYLLYGETGSITKIKSKMRISTTATVFVRLKDWPGFANAEIMRTIDEVVIIGLPFVPTTKIIMSQWSNQWEHNLQLLRKYQIESIAGQVRLLGTSSVEYWDV
jgi:DNA polymerase III epsilon subunit-like protein